MNETTTTTLNDVKQIVLRTAFRVVFLNRKLFQKHYPHDYAAFHVLRYMFRMEDIETCWKTWEALVHENNQVVMCACEVMREIRNEHRTQPPTMSEKDKKHLGLT